MRGGTEGQQGDIRRATTVNCTCCLLAVQFYAFRVGKARHGGKVWPVVPALASSQLHTQQGPVWWRVAAEAHPHDFPPRPVTPILHLFAQSSQL